MDHHLPITGLTAPQVEQSKKKYGDNHDTSHDTSYVEIILKTILSMYNVIIVSLILILLLIRQFDTARFIGLVAAINTIIALVQEIRARMIIKKLTAMREKTTTVIRSSAPQVVPVDTLVIGDVVSLSGGDKVPVDGTLCQASYAEFDESMLTGESQYVSKKNGDTVLSGSFLVAGSCFFSVTKFSRDSYIQTMTKEVVTHGEDVSPLQSEINQIIKALSYMTVFFICLLVLEGLVQENQKEEIIINAATLVSSMVPQGLVLITTVSFAYGAMQIAKRQAIIQRLSAIESIANSTMVCMDKTGTLTKNAFVVKEISWIERL